MIIEGLDLGIAGEAARIPLEEWLKAGVRIIADDATDGVVELRRAMGDSGPVVAYDPPVTVPINGSAIVEQTVEDCSHLAVIVTTIGTGFFDVEYQQQGQAQYTLETVRIDLSSTGSKWGRAILNSFERKSSFVVSPDLANSAALEARGFIDSTSFGAPISGGSITVGDSINTIDLGVISGIEIYCTTAQANQYADLWVYTTQNIESVGLTA